VAVMQREHELGRLYIRAWRQRRGRCAGEPAALMWFVQHGKSYVKLLREHITKRTAVCFLRPIIV